MSGKKALILGVSGMVGSALANELINDGWDVYGAARFTLPEKRQRLQKKGVSTISFDVTSDDPKILPDVDVVFLEIWDPGKPELIWPINFYGVGRVVERFTSIADIVNGCTINVYGDSSSAATEESSLRPTSEYGHSRVAQEKLIDYFSFKGGKKAVHVRYAHANTVGRGLIWEMAKTILAQQSLGPDPDARIQVIALEDFVRVTKLALQHASCPPVHVNCCHPKIWTRRQLAQEIKNRLGKGKVIFDRGLGGIANSAYADVTRMIDWFGEPRVDLETLFQMILKDLK